MALRIKIEKFLKLEKAWKKLFRRAKSDNPFLSWKWNDQWLTEFSDKSNAKVIVAERNSDIVGLALLGSEPVLRFESNPELADYSNFLYDPKFPEAIPKMIDFLFHPKKGRSAVFEPLRSNEQATDILGNFLYSTSLIWRRREICDNPYISTAGDFSSYFSSLKRSLRQELRTSVNTIKRHGYYEFRIAENRNEAREIYEKLVLFHMRRQRKKRGHSIFALKKNFIFFRNLLDNSCSDLTIQLSALKIDKEIVSAVYAIETRGSFYYWIPSFDEDIHSVSLGKLHIKHLIEYCFNSKISRFDFMGGNEPYKFQWTKSCDRLIQIRIFSNSIKALAFDTSNLAEKKIRNSAPFLKLVKVILFIISKIGKS